MGAAYQGYFINLDRSVDRRARLEAQLSGLGRLGDYQRFPARTGDDPRAAGSPLSPGEIGCFLSHLDCVRAAPRDIALHVIEDDVVFGPRCFTIIDQVIEEALSHFDLVFTDIFVTAHPATLRLLVERYRWAGMLDGQEPPTPRSITYLPLEHQAFAGSASYFVRPGAHEKLLAVFEEHLKAGGPKKPVDFVIADGARRGRFSVGCMIPFLSSVETDSVFSSTVRDSLDRERSALAAFLLRYFFYLDRDPAVVGAILAKLEQDREPGLAPLLAGIAFMLGDKFQVF